MRLGLMLATILLTALTAPAAATAAEPLDGDYWYFAAATKRPQLHLSVFEGRGLVIGIARVRCLRAAVDALPRKAFRPRDGRFRVRIPLAMRLIGAGKPRDRLVVRGRWTSPTSVSGKLRLVLRVRRPGRRVRYCDSGWRAWRAARLGSVGVRTSAADSFPVPGTLTTTATVFNDGDYDSPDTQVSIAPNSRADEGEPEPARPAPVVSTTQGTCRWPTTAEWGDDYRAGGVVAGAAILCDLGTLPARGSATVTITESWTLEHCGYEDGQVVSPWSDWQAAVRSPLNLGVWAISDDEDTAFGECPEPAEPGG